MKRYVRRVAVACEGKQRRRLSWRDVTVYEGNMFWRGSVYDTEGWRWLYVK